MTPNAPLAMAPAEPAELTAKLADRVRQLVEEEGDVGVLHPDRILDLLDLGRDQVLARRPGGDEVGEVRNHDGGHQQEEPAQADDGGAECGAHRGAAADAQAALDAMDERRDQERQEPRQEDGDDDVLELDQEVEDQGHRQQAEVDASR